ncbi:SDR family oxidoreductase [Cryomorphaceae bacterium 1068]|nr:SDR family oxidoreductase [Cryomorphaceae bacterium 1068]
MKNILIIGAHGKIGQILSNQLSESTNFQPTAFIRKESQQSDFKIGSLNFKVGNLEESVKDLTHKFEGYDAVVFTAGSGGSTGPDKTLSIDLDGAVRTMEAAKAAGIKRFVMVSAAGADDRSFWDKAEMKPYYVAKHYADEMLRNSDLNYTILRPVMLTNNDGTGLITASETMKGLNNEISRADVANAIEEVLNREDTYGKTIEMSEGYHSIEEAISGLTKSELELA